MKLIGSYAYLAALTLSTAIIGILGVPLMANEAAARKIAVIWGRTNLIAARLFCGIKSDIRGREHARAAPAIVAAKHQSMWETLKLYQDLPRPCFVLKKELKSIPMFGWWCQACGFIFVDRDAGASALRSLLADAKHAIENGASHIVIFPEGTRVAPGECVPYQPGVAALAKALKLPVVPVAHNAGSYWLTPGPRKIPGTIILEYLPPLPPGMARDELTTALEASIEGAMERLESIAPGGQDHPSNTQPGELSHGG